MRSAVDPAMQIFQSIFRPGLVRSPCHAVHPRRSLTFKSVIALPPRFLFRCFAGITASVRRLACVPARLALA